MLLRVSFILLLLISNLYAENLKKCEWNNSDGIPCTVISKTPNTSSYNGQTINSVNNKITNFSFTRSDFNLSTLDTVVVTDDKYKKLKPKTI